MGLMVRVLLATLLCAPAFAQQKFITVASTTSTEQSGLFKHLLPIFEKKSGIQVRVVALGTGQSLDMGKRGDADVVFVHAKPLEEKFVAEGFGVQRFEVMYNDFVLVGPKSDPAKVGGTRDIVAGLQKIKSASAPFASRGDKSGTHFAEVELWMAAGVDIAKDKGAWYRETGSGMGPTLNTASGMNAYALTDRGTWLSFKNRGDLVISVQGDQRLFNQYGVMLVNPAKHPHVKKEMGQAFIDWLVSVEGQKAIADYKIGGEQLFFPERPKVVAAQEAVRLYAAGSLRGALTEVGAAYEAATGEKVAGTFGASGLLRDRIEKGEPAEVFASANMEHPRSLVSAGRAGEVRLFARNRLCGLAAPGVRVDSATLLERMLDPAVKLGTSTPKADPSGDYAFELFGKAEALRAGAKATLEQKALKLTGGADSPQPPKGRSVYGMLVGDGKADLFLTYCTNAAEAKRENPALQIVSIPDALAVGADYGLTVLTAARPEARRLADFILSPSGQAILVKHGFSPGEAR